MKSIIAFAAAAILSTAAFAADPAASDRPAQRAGAGSQQPADASARPAGARETADSSARSENPDQMFLRDAISGNMLEVQLGQIAQDKAQDDQVKQFASMLVKDHTQALQRLRTIAKSANVQVEDQMKPVHQAKLQEMQKLPADAFTRKFAVGQYAHHIMDVLEYTYQSQHAQSAELKQYASESLPKLRQHQEHAEQMAMTAVGASGTDTARPAGSRIPKTGAGAKEGQGRTGASDAQDNSSDRPSRSGATDQPSNRDKTGAGATDDTGAGGGRAQ